MMRTMIVSLLTAFVILFASGLVMAGEDCGDAAKKAGETTTKADPPKPIVASTR